jgi:predicted PurR-regulated permease PerM
MTLGRWLGLLVFLASLYVLWAVHQLVLMLFGAVLIAVAIDRLAGLLQARTRIKQRGQAILAAIGLLIALAIGAILLVVPPFVVQFRELTQLVPVALDRLDTWFHTVSQQPLGQWLQTVFPDFDFRSLITQAQPAISPLFQGGFALFASTLGGVFNLLLVAILALMVLFDPLPYRNAFVQLFPSFYRRRVLVILDRCRTSLDAWLIGILLNMSIIGILSGTGLALIGVKLALAHGVLAGMLTFIPNVGPALSVLPPMLVAVLDDPLKPLLVLGLYIIVQQLETNLLTPMVMSKQVSLLPAVTLTAQIFFATFFGFTGLLLALPLTVVAQVWFQAVLVEDVLNHWDRGPNWLRSSMQTEPVAELAAELVDNDGAIEPVANPTD